MDRPKWYSKLIHMAVVLAVLLALVGAALLPVAADVSLGVDVQTNKKVYCFCEDIYVTATITNSGNETALAVNATISWNPTGNAENRTPLVVIVGDIAASGNATANWTLHCERPDFPLGTTITVDVTETVAGRPAETGTGSTTITQYGTAELKVHIFTPEEGEIFTECNYFPLKFSITNNGTAPALFVNGTIFPSADVGIAAFGPDDCGMSYTTATLDRLNPNESYNWTVMMHCCGCDVPPLSSSIHVVPNGRGYCTQQQIKSRLIHSDIVAINQTYNVTCDAEPNPSKVCHNVTFTAWFGECAVAPMSWQWDFGDSSTPATGTGHDPANPLVVTHHYNSSDNFTAVVNVTDGVNVTGTCNVTVEVFPRLNAACNVTPFDFTKLCHDLIFHGTAVGGFPEGSMCSSGNPTSYNWTWDFDDDTIETGTGYSSGPISHHYNSTGNYTAVFTIEDDCMNNTATCNVTVEVFPPLDVSCNVSSNVTKVCHNVTFYGEAIDGIPDGYPNCYYNWTWDFWRDSSPYDSVSGSGSSSEVSYHFNETGNYTAIFFIEDDCWNNTANCTVNVTVHPGLNMTCEGHDSTVCNEVHFNATFTGGIPTANYTWTWDFGDPFDPTPGTTQNETHTYMCTGNYTATVTVCDDLEPQNCANCTVNVTITIEPPELISPPNGSMVVTGDSGEVCFNWTDIGCCNYTLQIWQKDGAQEKVWNVNTGKNSTWCVPLMPDYYKWQVIAIDMCGEWVQSEAWFFGVTRDVTYPHVTVDRPDGGETWTCGTQETIVWAATEYGTLEGGFGVDQEDLVIELYYSADQGATWTSIPMDGVNDGAHLWTVPDINSDQCLVRVKATDPLGNTGTDTSNSVFTIACGARVFITDAAVSANGTINVTIQITGVTDMAGADIWLSYDNSVVEVLDVIDGDLLGIVTFSIDNPAGLTKMNYFYAAVPGQTGDFIFAYVTLYAVGSGGDTSALDLDVKALFDDDGTPINHTTEDGVFSILALMEGDANLDGCVSIVDALFIAQRAGLLRIFNADQEKCADTTDEGSVTIVDALHIAQWLVDPDGSLGILGKPLWESPADDDMLMPVPC